MNILSYTVNHLYTLLIYLISFYINLIRRDIKDEIKKESHVNVDDIDFNVYCVVHKEKRYRLYVLKDKAIDIQIVKRKINRTITHACICTFDDNGVMAKYISDVTEHLNSFRIHFDGNEKILWKHVIFLSKSKDLCHKHRLYINVEGQETNHIINDILEVPFKISRNQPRIYN